MAKGKPKKTFDASFAFGANVSKKSRGGGQRGGKARSGSGGRRESRSR
jgi:hypothetical protein